MSAKNRYQFMEFQIKVLKIFRWWPNDENENWWKALKSYLLMILFLPNSITGIVDFVMLLTIDDDADMVSILELAMASICTMAWNYIIACSLSNKHGVKKLIGKVATLEKFSSLEEMIAVDQKGVFMTKVMLLYATAGSLTYSLFPLLNVQECEAKKTQTMRHYGIACGMVCRIRTFYKYDYTPMYQLQYGHQIILVVVTSSIMIFMTMLIYGFVIQATHHMKVLKRRLMQLSECKNDEVEEKLKSCILYHIAIIEFCDDINASFGSQSVMHITATSLVISVLGFQLVTVNLFDAIRFLLHLWGWIMMLLTVCFIGQTLMDESIDVAQAAYNTKWYKFSVSAQKDIKVIIMRAQKPIMLKAMNLGDLSFATFLSVMSTAYSYLTLLINIK